MTDLRIDLDAIRSLAGEMRQHGDELRRSRRSIGAGQASIRLNLAEDPAIAWADIEARTGNVLAVVERMARDLDEDSGDMARTVGRVAAADDLTSSGSSRWFGPVVGPLAGHAGRWLLDRGRQELHREADLAGDVARATLGAMVGTEMWDTAVRRGLAFSTGRLYGLASSGHDVLRLIDDPAAMAWQLARGEYQKPATGDFGGAYTSRTVEPFIGSRHHDGAERGRATVVHLVAETGRESQIYSDEFEVIDNGNNNYTVVLPGVTDLSNPVVGLNPHTRSVRDLDVNAIGSTLEPGIAQNAYAQMVERGLRHNGVPRGAKLLLVGHSFGSDTALDLAADPVFNGRLYEVTHTVAVGYHSEPLLAGVQPNTEVFVVQNERDLVALAESIPDRLTPDDPDRNDHHALVRTFSGGLSGAGHHQRHYTSYLAGTEDPDVVAFFESVDAAGYTGSGTAVSIDVSVPGPGNPPVSPWDQFISPQGSVFGGWLLPGVPRLGPPLLGLSQVPLP